MKPQITAQHLASVIIGAALLGGTLPAQAGEPVDPDQPRTWSITVKYGDLDLSDPEGIERLYQRLRMAAGKVCGPGENHRNLRMRAAWQQCYDSTLDDAVAVVGEPALTAYHFENTGREVVIASRVATTP